MVTKSQTVEVNFSTLPTILESYKLLDDITKRKCHSVPRKVDKPLILYGAGNLGKMAKQYFDTLKIPILYIVDRNQEPYKNDAFWNDFVIYKPENISLITKQSSLLVICIIKESFNNISKPLIEQGWTDIVPFYDIAQYYNEYHPLNNGWFSGTLTNEDIKNIEYVLSKLEDDISRAYYLQFIAWHALREEWVFKDAPIINSNKYFIPEIINVLHNNEVFIDIGAHHGEYTLKFLDVIKNKFRIICAFEPDRENFEILYNNLKEKKLTNEKIYLPTRALGNEEQTKLFYSGLDSISQLSELGQEKINVTTLDDISLPEFPTFIKIHTEGTEGDIIEGGLITLILNRPILTVTIYHNRNGLWKLPRQIIKYLDDYIFYFRLHAWNGTSGIIYAIPKERIK